MKCPAATDIPPLRLRACMANAAALTLDEKGVGERAVRDGAQPRLRVGRVAVESRVLPGRSAHRTATSRSWRRPSRGRRSTRCRPEAALARSGIDAGGCSRWPVRPLRIRWRAELVLAADQFIITPAGRAEEAARARAAGEEVRTVIAGYHWFTDWGRDTMISLEGLTLTTGRYREAGYILRDVRALRSRRADPQHVPRRRARGPVSHGRRDALVLPRGAALPRSDRRRRTPCASCCRQLADIVAPSSARARSSASAWIQPTACCGRGSRAIS